jgi:hypothetical protein
MGVTAGTVNLEVAGDAGAELLDLALFDDALGPLTAKTKRRLTSWKCETSQA